MNGLEVTLFQHSPIPLNVTLHCEPGEVLALVGPSGSGKSTVLRCIAGLYRPKIGSIRCRGKTWYCSERKVNLTPQLRRVGFVFQHFELMPHLSVLGNLCLALGELPRNQRKAKARKLLARVHLEGFDERMPAQLSGGQQQRVALARALARDPELLLLDEPFSAVDQVTRRKLRREMIALTRSIQIPIVLVTHDLDEASMLGDQISVLQNGNSLQQGLSADVLGRPASATIARLIDLRNLFEARVVSHQIDKATTKIDWGDMQLQTSLAEQFNPGESVCFCIAPDKVLLHQRVRPSGGRVENPVALKIRDIITVGSIASLILDTRCGKSLEMDLPPHVVERNHLTIGDEVSVSLLGESIHLMPWQTLR